ncbi:MAG: BON domain-containing protein [Cytophagales bacterium]|nr:BON domain-containing protein [Rhizobacter sp.]
MTTFKTSATALCAISLALALGACQRNNEERTAGQKLDTTVAGAEQKAAEIKSDVKQEAREAQQGMNRAADTMSDKMKDASITTAINAELARDSELSALKINVDTASGRVVLRGTAPNDASRTRASTLASRVDGVQAVDNQLTVRTKG